jgi:hypothetical protein
MRVTPCPGCLRHVRVDARVCPFCDHSLSSSSARAKVGMLIGAAAISTLTACPRPATKYGGPPPPEQSETAKPEQPETPS